MGTLLDRDGEESKLLSQPRTNALLTEHAEAVVSMTALFEDDAWQDQVECFTHLLNSGLGGNIALQVRHWTYGEIQNLRAERIASELAEQTDLLLLVTHADSVLPEAVGRWIAAWLRQANESCAAVCLVGLNEEDTPESGVARNFRNACAHANVEFFARHFKLDASRRSIARSPQQVSPCQHPLSGIMHWGINE